MTKKTILLIIIALLSGVIATLFVAQHDAWVQDQCVTYIKQRIEQDTHSKLSFKSAKIGFFFPELTLEDVHAVSDSESVAGAGLGAVAQPGEPDQAGSSQTCAKSGNWSWHAQKVSISFSWFHIIKHRGVDFHVQLQGCHIETDVCDSIPAIYPYICSFFASSAALPIASFVKEVELADSSLKMVDAQRGLVVNTQFKSVSKELFGAFKTVVHVSHADTQVYGNTVVDHAQGLMTITLPGFLGYSSWQGPWLQVDVDLCADIPHLDKTTCFVAGSWINNEGTFFVQHMQEQMALDPLVIRLDDQGLFVDMQAQFPASYAWRLYAGARDAGAQDTSVKDADTQTGQVGGSGEKDKIKNTSNFTGQAELGVQGYVTGNQECRVQLTVKDLAYGDTVCCQELTVSASHKKIASALLPNKNKQDKSQPTKGQEQDSAHSAAAQLEANFTAKVYDIELAGKGTVEYETGCAFFELSNVKRVAIPGLRYWYLDPQSVKCAISRDQAGVLTGLYECTVQDSVHQHAYAARGQFNHKDGELFSEGAINSGTYAVRAALDPFVLRTCEYVDQAGTRLVVLSSSVSQGSLVPGSAPTNFANTGIESPRMISGTVSYDLARSLLNGIAGVDVQGQGSIQLSARSDGQTAQLQLGLKDGMIRMGHTYNFINNFQATLTADYQARTLILHNLLCGLQTGSLSCERATVQFDQAKNIAFIHAPFVFDRCLFNMQKNLFAMISGSCLFEKRGDNLAHLKSAIIIDRAHAKDAAFLSSVYTACSTGISAFSQAHNQAHAAQATQAQPGTQAVQPAAAQAGGQAASDMSLDVTLETKEPIVLDTPLLKADIGVHLTVGGTVLNPRVEGDVIVNSGSLTFPYKPLQITKGLVRFDPDNLFNPTVELKAKNKIKKHEVTLYAHGTLQDHHVLLDASPALTEEQIVSLLLVGSPEESLSAVVPALIIQNLKVALLGSGTGSSFLDSYFKQSRMPFSVHLVPSFTDQTGRGGLRGGLEFLVNDRWRALIQKNFSLTEDTRFELEYSFSDDVAVRAIRDERRDLGGELEMRWKF
jgi:hypothetical protein